MHQTLNAESELSNKIQTSRTRQQDYFFIRIHGLMSKAKPMVTVVCLLDHYCTIFS